MPFRSSRSFQKGSLIFVLYASIAMVGVIGVAAMHVMKGPVRAMSQVTKRTIAENNMIASGRLALMVSARETGDCDSDGIIEPLEWDDAGGQIAPLNGGLLPGNIGAALQDPWGSPYGYCAWDQGSLRNDVTCGNNAKRLKGSATPDKLVIAILSPGPDRVYQTGCQADGAGEYLLSIPQNDDVVMPYSYADAVAMSAGLWNLKAGDLQTATIDKNLSVTDNSGDEQLSFNADSKALEIGTGGTGSLPNIKTDFIQNLTANAPVEILSNIDVSGDVDADGMLSAESATITTSVANAVAAIVTASGGSGIGLKASGTSKAIEAAGIIDMTNHKITNLAEPTADSDAATKKYIDDKIYGPQKIKCESFVFTSCTGAVSNAGLAKTNLGVCKKACEAANMQCCEAEFASLPGDPNIALTACRGYAAPSQTSGGLRNLLTILLGGGKFVAALCYLE